jgi:hypothetical protein
MVNKALVLENRIGILECKCKQERQSQLDKSSRPCIGSSSTEPISRPVLQQFQQRLQPIEEECATPQRHVIDCPNNFQTPNSGNQIVQRTQANQISAPNHNTNFALATTQRNSARGQINKVAI